MANEPVEIRPEGENAIPVAPSFPAAPILDTRGVAAGAPAPDAPAPSMLPNPAGALHLPKAPARRRHPRRRRGKVARLPLQIRNLVNQSLRDGLPYAEIAALLAARGFPGIAPAHLGSWAQGGYRSWLALQERFESSSPLSDRAAALLGALREDGRSDLADLNASLLNAQFLDLIENVDPSNLRQLLAEKPQDYFRLTKAVTALAIARSHQQELELKRLKYELEMRKIHEREARRLQPQAITPEIQARIDAAVKLL